MAILLLLSTLFVFLWHPRIHPSLSAKSKMHIIGAILILSLGLYIYKGSPNLADHPFHYIQKISTPKAKLYHQREIPILIGQINNNPNSSKTWALLAKRYFDMKHYYESALHYREAWQLDPKNLMLKILYAQSIIMLHKGRLSPVSKKLLEELSVEKYLPDPGHQLVKKFLPKTT